MIFQLPTCIFLLDRSEKTSTFPVRSFDMRNIMRNLKATLFTIAGLVLIWGCPMQTENSIDNGSYPVPDWLTGKWKEIRNDNHGSTYLFIKDNVNPYMLKAFTFDSTDSIDKSDTNRILLSDVGGCVFFNFYNSGEDGDVSYLIFKMEKIGNSEIILRGLKEGLMDYSASQDEIKSFLIQMLKVIPFTIL
jgi:hypothetical protein